MNKKSVLITVMMVFLCCSVVYGDPWPGSGDANDPYQIHNAAQMQAIGADANCWGAHFKLMKDIDLGAYTGTSFNIIGIYIGYNDPNNRPFTGVFDGGGHVISNFTYDSNGLNDIGLFGYVDDPNAELKNFGLVEPNVDAGNGVRVGCIAGNVSEGTIIDCYANGGRVAGALIVGGICGRSRTILNSYSNVCVEGSDYIGGLVGYNWYGNVSDCYSTGSVSGISSAGGLVGSNEEGNIQGCYSRGGVRGEGWEVGGLVGSNSGEIQGCYSTANVIGGAHFVGGVTGYNGEGKIQESYSTGEVTGVDRVGGLVGENWLGNVSDCYSRCSVIGIEDVGGLVGVNNGGDIQGCYSTGSVTGIGDDDVGGLIGVNYGDIKECYSTGSVSGVGFAGGLVGWGISFYVTDSFWDVNSSGTDVSYGGIGLPTVEMQTESTFTDAGWDFVDEVINGPNDIWDICEGTNYPKLVWSIPAGDFMCPDGVNMFDFAVLGEAWFSEAGDLNWDAGCDISKPEDEVIDGLDLAVFVGNWLFN